MSDAHSIGWIQIVGWSVAVGGSAVSLFWNFANRRHTDKLAKRIRSENFRADQWAEVRNGIQGAQADFCQAVESILTLAPSPSQGPLVQQLEPLNLQLMVKHGALCDALQEAERNSLYVETQLWMHRSYGVPYSGGETPWDRINSCLAAASSASDDATARAALSPLRAEMAAIKQCVAEGVRIENTSHDPDKY